MYNINLELTKCIYNVSEIKEMVKIKQCYNNCFSILTESYLRSGFFMGKYKIALAYVNIGLHIWIRHCVIIDENNEILDLTYMAIIDNGGSVTNSRDYKIVKTFSCDEYLENIESNFEEDGFRCDFPNLKEEYDFYIEEKTKDKYFMVNESDFFEYLMPMIRSNKKIKH